MGSLPEGGYDVGDMREMIQMGDRRGMERKDDRGRDGDEDEGGNGR